MAIDINVSLHRIIPGARFNNRAGGTGSLLLKNNILVGKLQPFANLGSLRYILFFCVFYCFFGLSYTHLDGIPICIFFFVVPIIQPSFFRISFNLADIIWVWSMVVSGNELIC